MSKHKNSKTFHREKYYNSLTAFKDHAQYRSHVSSLQLHELSSRTAPSKDNNQLKWYGTKTFEDMLSLINRGWPEGMEKVKDLTIKYRNLFSQFFPTQDYQQNMETCITGEVVDIDKYLSGEPENMMHFVQNNEDVTNLVNGGKLQRIIVNCCCNCHIEAKTVYTRNALICALINAMELYGFRVEVSAAFSYTGSSYNLGEQHRQQFFIMVKPFDGDLNLDRITLALAHPSTQRRLIFSLMEEESGDKVHDDIICASFIRNSYGYAVDLTEKEIINFGTGYGGQSMKINSSNLYFNMLNDNYTIEQMVEQCNSKLRDHFKVVSFNKDKDK